MRAPIFAFVFVASLSIPALAEPSAEQVPHKASEILMEEMTWPEISAAIKAGRDIVLVPTGGTEQTGPHIVTGKHNFILEYTSLTIAERLDKALVAPILPIVPEGDINPPQGHMRFAGTISLRPETFAAVLEDTARSLKQHGFKMICFIGEHGSSQEVQRLVAAKLNAEWESEHVKVLQVNDYYDDHNGQTEWLKASGQKDTNPQAHGGLADTSEMLAVHPDGVRDKLRGAYGPADGDKLGVDGPSDKASMMLGAKLVDLKVEGALKQIRTERAK